MSASSSFNVHAWIHTIQNYHCLRSPIYIVPCNDTIPPPHNQVISRASGLPTPWRADTSRSLSQRQCPENLVPARFWSEGGGANNLYLWFIGMFIFVFVTKSNNTWFIRISNWLLRPRLTTVRTIGSLQRFMDCLLANQRWGFSILGLRMSMSMNWSFF